jgi:uncharacterized protein involved in outer membrane biogenesis
MSAESANPRPSKASKRRWAVIVLCLIALVAIGGWYFNSVAFEERVRQRVIAELERATGGRVDLPSFEWHLTKMEFVAKDLTIHGTEPVGEPAYAHVDYLKVRLKIISFFGGQIGLRSIEAQHPVLHITVRDDGATNQPAPVLRQMNGQPPSLFSRIFDLVIDRLDVDSGLLEWNEHRVPLDIHADNISAHASYSVPDKRYEGIISMESSSATMAGSRPLTSSAELHLAIARDGVEIKSLKWASAASKLDAHGRITQLADPKHGGAGIVHAHRRHAQRYALAPSRRQVLVGPFAAVFLQRHGHSA